MHRTVPVDPAVPVEPALPAGPRAGGTISRRTLAAGAAWSAPAVMAVVAAPLAAASETGSESASASASESASASDSSAGAAALSLDRSEYSAPAGGTITTIAGSVPAFSSAAGGEARPSIVTLSYPEGFSGPSTATVDPASGVFSVGAVGVPATATSGTLFVLADGYSGAAATLYATTD